MRLFTSLIFGMGLLLQTHAKASGLNQSFNQIQQSYPSSRVIEGSLSLLYGVPTLFAGTLLAFDGNAPGDEVLTGWLLLLSGTAASVDGLVYGFGESYGEMAVGHYRRFRTPQYGEGVSREQWATRRLKNLAHTSRRKRYLRAAVDLITAGGYFYLYTKGPKTVNAAGAESGKDVYESLIYPAGAIALLGIYRIFFPSVEESAADALGLQTQFNILPSGFQLSLNF